MPIFISAVIDATSNILLKSTHLLPTIIGLPCYGRQNFKKIGDEIPAFHSPLPVHVLAFPEGCLGGM